MIEERGDLWVLEADAKCITTNGYVKTNGEGVMGRGVAQQATVKLPGIARALGHTLQRSGNHVSKLAIDAEDVDYFSFPVKHHWRDMADIDLIVRSARELMTVVIDAGYDRVLLPRPGCGNGQLHWPTVRRVVEPYLDDCVVVIDR